MASPVIKNNMEYRFLGPTGLKVSLLSYGPGLVPDTSEETQATYNLLIKKAYDAGINFFDNAEIYSEGKSEIVLGRAIKQLNLPREQLVISTKVFWGGSGPNDKGLSRKHVIEGVKNSLKRLQLDYVDVVFCHRPDLDTPVEETCRAFDFLINQGLTFYWGTSEWPADRIQKAIGICEKYGLHKPIVEQPEYSLLVRDRFEVEYASLFDEYKLGTTIFSPLAGGILTGKYNDGIPEGSRYANTGAIYKALYEKYFSEEKRDKTIKKLHALSDLAAELGATQPQLALAWTLTNKNVSTAIFGSTKESQFDDNLKAFDVYRKLTPEVLERIEKIFGNKGAPAYNWKAWN